MAVNAVASVVLQKLLLVDESFTTNKILSHRLRGLKAALESPFIESVDQDDKEIKKLTAEYLGHLYTIEDWIESFALSFTRQRKKKKLGCLINHALFLKKLTALGMLHSKLNTIQMKVKALQESEAKEVKRETSSAAIDDRSEGSSMKRTKSSPSVGNTTPESPKDLRETRSNASMLRERTLQPLPESDEENEAQEVKRETSSAAIDDRSEGSSMKRTKSSPSVGNTTPESPKDLRKTRSNGSMLRERWEQSKLMYTNSYNEEERSVVGYQQKVAELRQRLDSSGKRIIPIVGEFGSGKTMLARAIYGNRDVKKEFIRTAWANVFEESTTTDILLILLNQMKKSQVESCSDVGCLKQMLRQELSKRKYLIVLDGIQTWEQWESLQDAFPDEQNESKIIVTTCNSDRKWHCEPYYLKKLNCDETWSLFMKKVGSQADPEPSHKEKIDIICGGLPLNIVLLGSLLSTKDRRKWSETLDSRQEWQASDIMKLCYNDLENHTKLCLIYMTLFPKEIDIPVRRLQRLWLAEGFVEQRQGVGEFQEDVAFEYFENLVRRSLIMVSKQRSDGSARRCRLQGALHGFLTVQAREIGLFHVNDDHGSTTRDHTRRLVEYANGSNSPLELSQFQKVRSYISFNFQKKDTPAKHVSSLVRKYKLLRVLDLEGVYNPSLPENLGDMFHLRYIGLRWTFLDRLPKSVGELPYLQTLDLKHTRIDKIPTSIWKLKNLQHLNLDEVHLDKDTLLHLQKSLPELLTLWGLSVSHESPIENGLVKLSHLRELGITFRSIKKNNSTDQGTEALVDWISKQKDLKSLRLRSIDDSGNPSDLVLKPFSSLRKLSHMKLLGKLQRLPPSIHFPPHVKVLTLSLSYLTEDPMPILGELPDLTVLRLLGNSYRGETMVCPSGKFKNLEVLKLWMLENLKKWEVEDGAMEKLKEVNIRRCTNMKSFPSNLLQQKCFQDLILNNMPPAFKGNIDKEYQSKVSTKDFKFES